MEFIHAIDLENFYPCWNLHIDGKLRTPNYMASIDVGLASNHRTIDQFSIDELRVTGPQECGVTPRTIGAILKAAILRRGQIMVNGYNEEILVSEETRQFLIKSSDVELEFERIRRLVPDQNVSRLSCIWLAERTLSGDKHIKEMLGDHVYILKVRITNSLSISRVDSDWFDMYWREGNPNHIVRYWSGEASSEKPKWEYLFDGEIVVEDPVQLEFVKQHGNIHPGKA